MPEPYMETREERSPLPVAVSMVPHYDTALPNRLQQLRPSVSITATTVYSGYKDAQIRCLSLTAHNVVRLTGKSNSALGLDKRIPAPAYSGSQPACICRRPRHPGFAGLSPIVAHVPNSLVIDLWCHFWSLGAQVKHLPPCGASTQ